MMFEWMPPVDKRPIKLIFVGDVAVGKTSLIRRFVDDVFVERTRPTVGVRVFSKKIDEFPPHSGEKIHLQLWDLSAHAHYDLIRPSYYAGAAGVVYVADVTRVDTIEHLERWMQDISMHVPRALGWAVSLNKVDFLTEVKSMADGEASWREHHAHLPEPLRNRHRVFYTSAKLGINVTETMRCVLSQVLASRQ